MILTGKVIAAKKPDNIIVLLWSNLSKKMIVFPGEIVFVKWRGSRVWNVY